MAMTVGGVNPYVSNYNRIDNISQKTTQRISTGSEHPSASMGAAEYAINARLTSNIGATSQSIQNSQNISSAVKVAEGATKNTLDGLSKVRAQLINALNDTNGTLDRQAIQKNINQVVAQINSNAYVQYNDMTLLDGSKNSLRFAGIDGYENFQVGDLRTSTLGLTDEQGNVTIDASTNESAKGSLEIVDSAISVVGDILDTMHFLGDYVADGFSPDISLTLEEATTQGAQLQRLEFQQANYVTMEENQMGAQAASEDTDIARQVMNLRSEQTQQQFALFASKMFDQNRMNVLSLLP